MTAKDSATNNVKAEPNGKAKLDERFITTIQGKEFVVYAGLLDLAHQKGLHMIEVEVIQFPTKENCSEAICKCTVESNDGATFIEWGDANPKNTNQKIVNHILRMAATRAKARALRDFTNIGMTCLEELDCIDDVIGVEKPAKGRSRTKPESGSGQSPTSSSGNGNRASSSTSGNGSSKAGGKDDRVNGTGRNDSGPKPSTAQVRAIESLARRRNMSTEELDDMAQQQFGTSFSNINASEASNLIRLLQHSA